MVRGGGVAGCEQAWLHGLYASTRIGSSTPIPAPNCHKCQRGAMTCAPVHCIGPTTTTNRAMARITRKELDGRAETAAIATQWDLWLQKSLTGYSVMRTNGKGADALAECLTASEAKEFLRGLAIGATFKG